MQQVNESVPSWPQWHHYHERSKESLHSPVNSPRSNMSPAPKLSPPPTGVIQFKWDPKNLEIRTKSIELTLEPLVQQVTTLVSQSGPSNLKKGRSKKAKVLSAAVQRATENFIEKGEEIARENPEMEKELMAAVEEVRQTGSAMQIASQEFAAQPCSSMHRGVMVRAARALLSAVTRLLIIADMVDIHLLMSSLHGVENGLDRIKNATNQQQLLDSFRDFGHSMADLQEKALRRQADMKDPRRRDDLAAARAVLKKNSMMLLTASKVYVRHPEIGPAKSNRDFAYSQVCDAVNTISGVAQATGKSTAHPYERAGELAAALDELDQKIIMDPLSYDEVRSRPSLEERLESIISGAALMADSSCTRDDRKERIIQECNAVRQALQDLLSQYMQSAGKSGSADDLDEAIDHVQQKTRDLRRQLRKAVVDHVSDSFLETNVPLLVLIDAAKRGDQQQVEEYAKVFTEHANKLVEVANLACSMSTNEEGVKMVRLAAIDIAKLCPEVINAARILAARPQSKAALDNLTVFQQIWEDQVRLLTEAVDDITTIEDFLAVSENHILEDVNKCVMAMQDGDADTLDRTAGAIRGRSARVCNVVQAEMDNYEPGSYTDRVLESVDLLRDQVMPNFAGQVQTAVDALTRYPQQLIDENEFIEANRLVYDGVREIRQAVLMNRPYDEIESDTEFEPEENHLDRSIPDYLDGGGDGEHYNDQALMLQLPMEDQQKIQVQVQEFREEKYKLDKEVAKWDDSANDIVVLAKQMCMIMMEMTDFTRGRGPLKSTMHVISAAKKISEYGSNLDHLASKIADQCPDSVSKNDLQAYLQRTTLYCHQLNITSKVKADVQGVSGQLVLSGLDSATSLIQAAKNLMNTVVLVVKACYVASTKYSKKTGNRSIVQWKMKAPEKKPLIHREDPESLRSQIRKSARKKQIAPIKALSEFQ